MIKDSVLLDARIQIKRMHSLLTEVMDLTGQLIDAADRGDEVAIRLLLEMRAEPIDKLTVGRKILEQQRDILTGEEKARFAQLLNGECAKHENEQALAEEVNAALKLFSQVIEYDRRLSLKLAREESVYENDLHINHV